MRLPSPLADAVFVALLRAFPREFRVRFAHDMAATFREGLGAQEGAMPRAMFLCRAYEEIVRMGLAERFAELTSPAYRLEPAAPAFSREVPMERLGHDIRAACRSLARTPGFVLVVVLTLAVGIGANATMFATIDQLYFRPPAGVGDAERVVKVVALDRPSDKGFDGAQSYPLFKDLQRGITDFDHVAVTADVNVATGRGSSARQLHASTVSGDFFAALEARPALGRFFLPGEDHEPVGAHVVVISYGFWKDYFGGAHDVIGKMLELGPSRFQVIGVAPEGFTGASLTSRDVWIPVSAAEGIRFIDEGWNTGRGMIWLQMVAHVRPGVSLEQAAEQATTVWRAEPAPSWNPHKYDSVRAVLGSLIPGKAPHLKPVPEQQVAKLVAGVSLLVLIIACANVANLLLARAMRRRREVGVRLALGLGRWRLIRSLLIESVLLSAIGAVAALGVVAAGTTLIRRLLFPTLSFATNGLDHRVLAFMVAVGVVTGIASGLAPALQASSDDLQQALKQGARDGFGHRSRMRTALLVVQGSMSLILLAGTGIFTRSLRNIDELDLGLDVHHTMTATVDLRGLGYSPAQATALLDQMQARVQSLPGVQAAGLSVGLPFAMSYGGEVRIPGRAREAMPQVNDGGPYEYAVSPEYFSTMEIHLVAGRPFTDRRSAVAIVNETMARLYWPGADPVGRCIYVNRDSTCTTVIGVAGSSRRGDLTGETSLQFFVPIDRAYDPSAARTLVIRVGGDPRTVAGSIRQALQSPNPNLPYVSIKPFSTYIEPQIHSWRLGASMFAIFGALALVVGLVGMYSALSYSVSQRVQEMGVRMALGARASDVVTLVVGAGIRVALIGAAIGLGVTLVAGRFVESMLFQEPANDPLVLGGSAVILVMAAAVASFVPALWASRVDPATALRAD